MIQTLIPHYFHPLAVFFIRKEAVIQYSLKRTAVEALAYKDDLLAAVAPFTAFGDVELNELVYFVVACKVILRGQGAKPRPAACQSDHGAGLGPLSG
jgi:hypothetical protein